jgi:hypothetical protein
VVVLQSLISTIFVFCVQHHNTHEAVVTCFEKMTNCSVNSEGLPVNDVELKKCEQKALKQ